jgi:hypothetical protein
MGKLGAEGGAVSGGEDSCQGDSGGPIFDWKSTTRSEGLDRCDGLREKKSSHPTSRGDGLPGTPETMDIPG